MNTVFLRALEADDKAAALRAAIHEPTAARGKQRFELDPASFASVPRSPFAYWISERVRQVFVKVPRFESAYRTVKQGLSSANDFRFMRTWWECPSVSIRHRWFTMAKGGRYSKYYAPIILTANWCRNGGEMKAFASAYRARKGWGDHWSAMLNSSDYYLRPGLTWPRRTQAFGPRALPAGCIFADKGPAAFVDGDGAEEILSILAVFSSRVFNELISVSLNAADATARSYEVGVIQHSPFPSLTATDRSVLAKGAARGWSITRSLDTGTETSHAFTLPALLQVEGDTLTARCAAWTERVRSVEAELATIQDEIDELCFGLYGIDDVDRRAIIEGFGSVSACVSEEASVDTDNDADDEADDLEDTPADTVSLTAEFVSWAVGVAFGRFDVQLATGDRPLPAEPEPFDSLPVCSPAMLTGHDGLPLSASPAGYPLALTEGGLLVDDPGHAHDLAAAVRAVFEVIFDGSADARWNEGGALLDSKDRNLRNWLSKGFFEHHLKHHSKSRRKAPIIWQLATPSLTYAVWLYAHRLTKDSLFQVQNDLVAQKLAHEERKHTALMQTAGLSPTASQRKEIDVQETLVEELRVMLEEVKRITPLWQPNLNDGIVLTMAPLWRLVPQHKAWQKELKQSWDSLCAGKYDWAHLAMHLWPERVVPQCTTDRSLAIAHGLEDVFWIEGSDGKWQPRKVDRAMIETLIKERTSLAVKDALKSMLDAPAPIGARGAGRTDSGRRASTRRARHSQVPEPGAA